MDTFSRVPDVIQCTPSISLWIQEISAVIAACSAVFSAFALLLNTCIARRTNLQNRSALVSECLAGFANDLTIQNAFYKIEYDEFTYGRSSFHRQPIEREIDKLLSHFSNLALIWQAGLLSTSDVRPVQYYVFRVMNDKGIIEYLEFMREWAEEAAAGEHPYFVLEKMTKALKEI